jgi:hypothetical protein
MSVWGEGEIGTSKKKKIGKRPNCKDTFSIVKGLTNFYIKTVSFCYLSIRISHVNVFINS